VLRLDTLDLESELARYKCELDLASISAEKLDTKYLNRFVLCLELDDSAPCPLNALLKIHQNIGQALNRLEADVRRRALASFVSGEAQDRISSRVQEAVAKVEQDLHQIAKTTNEIQEQQSTNEAKQSDLRLKIQITERQIELCTLLAPGPGTLVVHAWPETFVERGDLLFEVI
jgi:multidrug resistance efflux pump